MLFARRFLREAHILGRSLFLFFRAFPWKKRGGEENAVEKETYFSKRKKPEKPGK